MIIFLKLNSFDTQSELVHAALLGHEGLLNLTEHHVGIHVSLSAVLQAGFLSIGHLLLLE